MGAALSVCGAGAKLKMNIMDTLRTGQPLRVHVDGVKVRFTDTVSKAPLNDSGGQRARS